jgi:hypothetical protein
MAYINLELSEQSIWTDRSSFSIYEHFLNILIFLILL